MRGIPVLGPLKQALTFKEVKFVFGIGSMKTRFIREKIIKDIGLQPDDFVTIIHPLANIDRTATIGPGCILHAGVCIGNDAIVEGFNVIAVNSAIAPYVRIETFAMITSLVVILTGAQIGKMSFIGAHCCVTENVKIGQFVMVGVGSIVTRNVEDGLFVLGNPLRSISKTDVSTLNL
jgi:UDP-3-O-[3-hydroxymyristoyl] glucosamine N-acyltransferase